MLNSLDLLVIVFMGLVAAGMLGLCLMFLVRNPRIKKICLIATSALALYTGYIGIRIGGGLFLGQMAVGAAVILAAIAAVVLMLTAKEDEKKHKLARILSAAALVIGIINAFML